MQVLFAAATVVAVLATGTVMTAQEPQTLSLKSGQGLYEYCVVKQDHLSKGLCHGYIVGFVQGASLLSPETWPTSCFEAGVKDGQIDDVVRKYLQDHPEERHYKSFKLVALALDGAFCKKPAAPLGPVPR